MSTFSSDQFCHEHNPIVHFFEIFDTAFLVFEGFRRIETFENTGFFCITL